jgi:hypothetical protein
MCDMLGFKTDEEKAALIFWDTYVEEFKALIIGLHKQYPQMTFEDVSDSLLSVLLKYRKEVGV